MTSRRVVTRAIGRAAFAAALKDLEVAKAWSGASWTVQQADGDFAELIEAGLERLVGVDETLAAIGKAAYEERPSPELEELERDLPEGLFAIGALKGLGAKKVKALWEQLAITSLGKLEYAINENRLLDLKGFGEKTQEKVRAQLVALKERASVFRRDEARDEIAAMQEEAAQRGLQLVGVGAYRRGAELVKPLEVLLRTTGDEDVREFVASLEKRATVHVAEPSNFGAALIETTGSEAHVNALRARAGDEGLHGETEGEVYASLGLAFTPAERRQAHVPLVLAGTARPALVRREDLRGALHNHTTASDGTASLAAMRAGAEAQRLSYLGISEHSKAAAYARGLSPAKLAAQVAEIASMNEGHGGCVLLSGVESDILKDGALDYDDALLASLEIVIASVHQRFRQDGNAMTERMCRAARHPATALVGHPTGRLLLARPPTDVDMEALLQACAESGTAIELNANPQRLDLSAEHAAMAKEMGVLVSIGADAHSVEGLNNLEHGVAVARRAGLCAEDVLNARTLSELRAWQQANGRA